MNILVFTKDSVKQNMVAGEKPLARPNSVAAVTQGVYPFCASAKENVKRTIQLMMKRTTKIMMMNSKMYNHLLVCPLGHFYAN